MHHFRSFFYLTLIGMALIAGGNAQAAEKAAPAKALVRSVVQSQLDAFRKNDFKTAYGFAHTGVKEQFTQAQFEQMVRGGFPAMVIPGNVAFFEVQEDGANAEVQVTLTDEKGNNSGFRYLLEKDNGNWRIAAVIRIEIPEVLV